MPRIDCQSCKARLWVARDYPTPFFTCPRCLAQIPMTQAEPVGAPREPAPLPEKDVFQMSWGTRKVRPVELDVKMDIQGTGGCLVVVACLSTLGILGSFLLLDVVGDHPALHKFLAACFVALLISGLLLILTQKDPAVRGIGWSIMGLFGIIIAGIVGMLALIGLLFSICAVIFRT